ncbi:MAG: CNNM domain-containing protein [Planctomycetota bacterium]
MSAWLIAVLAVGCLVATALFAGSETGLYSLSRLRVESDARAGRSRARLIRRLLADETSLLATILIGTNLAIELLSRLTGDLVGRFGIDLGWRELVVTAILTPTIFFFGELFPKDLFRRRPHALVGATAPVIALSKGFFLPLTLPVRGMAWLIERSLGISSEALAQAQGREGVLELLHESERSAIPHVERMARNVLELRGLAVARVMVPWAKVEHLARGADSAAHFRQVAGTRFSRLPVVDEQGEVIGYVHQLEALGAGPGMPVIQHLRPVLSLAPEVSLDHALTLMRANGQRAALVGPPSRPLGLVTLKDIVEEISGELARW